MQQVKAFHWWLMTVTAVADFVGAQTNLFTPKTITWVLFAHGVLMIVATQLAAKWQPLPIAEEPPKEGMILPGELAKFRVKGDEESK